MSTKVVTGVCRASYEHLFEPWSGQTGQEPKFSVVLLLPKTDTVTYDALRAAEQAALEAGKNTKFGGKIPPKPASIIRDGDEEADLDKNPEYAGHWFLSVRSDRRPVVVDQNLNDIIEPSEVYSGCYVKASLNAFAYSVSGNKGVSFGLNAVQKVRDGEAFAGRVDAREEFDVIAEDDVV